MTEMSEKQTNVFFCDFMKLNRLVILSIFKIKLLQNLYINSNG